MSDAYERGEAMDRLADKLNEVQEALHGETRLREELEREVARLTGCLKRANSNMEEMERDLYLRLQALEVISESFLDAATSAVRHHENKGRGGQQVPFHGDFAHVPPSVVGQLRWWANEFSVALEKSKHKPNIN